MDNPSHLAPHFRSFSAFCLFALQVSLLVSLLAVSGCGPAEEPTTKEASSSQDAGPHSEKIQVEEENGVTFDISVGNLVPSLDEAMMRLEGEVFLPDGAKLEQVESFFKAELNGVNINVAWAGQGDGMRFGYVISDIVRTDNAQTLTLRWDGESLDSAQKGQREITVPARAVFTVTGARVVRAPERFIEVSFSLPLDREQNLDGLVSLNGEDIRPRVDGGRLRIYPQSDEETAVELRVSDVIRSSRGRTLDEDYLQTLVLSLASPGVRFVGASSILPPAERMSVPFEAANIDSVQVTAFKVFPDNMGQFLQNNSLTSTNADGSAGRYLWRKTYQLPENAEEDWQLYNLDLTELMAQHPEGYLRLELSIDRSNSLYRCDRPRPQEAESEAPQSHDGDWSWRSDDQNPDWYQRYYQSQGYLNYSERNNPCHESYYQYNEQAQAARGFMVSNIGLLAKQGTDQTLEVVATGLLDAEPLPNVEVQVFNYQQQSIGRGTTDDYGMATITTEGQAYYLTAEQSDKLGYLRLAHNEALPTNQFDIGGEKVRDGLKGFIYGERDVWRPGDAIHLTFILEDKDNRWPDDHPVMLDLFDPQGNKVTSQVGTDPVDGFYAFTLGTDESAPTGNYRAVVHLGSRYFDKVLKVETITPNRLKVDLEFAETPLRLSQMPARSQLSAQWLHGATAANLRADSEVRLYSRETEFEGYSQFTFDDPARTFSGGTQPVFDGELDDTGKAQFDAQLQVSSPPPGMLTAMFISRVFEPGGSFSTALRRVEFSPFEHWVGVQVPKGDGYNDAIARDQAHSVTFQSLNAELESQPGRELEVTLYKMDWRWWWDQGSENLASFIANQSHQPIETINLTTNVHGRANWTLEANTYDWGRYLLRVCDTEGNHCSGEVVYLGWSASNAVSPGAATQLMLSTDKDSYQVGETAQVQLPEIEQGRILLSLENGSQILERRWVDLEPGQNQVAIPVTSDMAPNVYAHISLLLPHQQRASDAPMRLYGLVPLMVEDPQTRLKPALELPEEVRPESAFQVEVSEQNNRAMTYTLALVDEGLLGITNYKTPDPHHHFYQREALGVFTWDLFEQVVGAYGASLQRVLAIGGSDADAEADPSRRERRFPPVVQFLGTFTLAAGENATHDIELPPYLGAVRVMLVAGKDGAYGRAEQSVTVTQPLSLLATLPRVVGPGEEISLPVQVFVNGRGAGSEGSDEADIEQVTIEATSNDLFTWVEPTAELNMAGKEDDIAELRLKVNDQMGPGRIDVTARSGSETARQTVHITSRAPNPPSVRFEQTLLDPGETWQSPLAAHGMAGTNQASLEVSRLPALNLERRLGYLLNYPHGCLEQVISSVFPQLYLNRLVELNDEQQRERESNIRAAIERLSSFQQADGSFSYWPGGGYANEWASTYAGHFLVEARRAGYGIPTELFSRWLEQQRQQARNYRDQSQPWHTRVAAYRLYTLALAGQAETSAMNRLREQLLNRQGNELTARRLLASAYYQIGLNDAAEGLLQSSNGPQVPGYDEPTADYTYGSELRDRAVLLQLRLQARDETGAWDLAETIANELSSDQWFNTQALSWALVSMAQFAGDYTGDQPLKFSLQASPNDDWQALQSQTHWYRQALDSPQASVRNDSDDPLRVLVSNRLTPAATQEQAESHGLHLDVRFRRLNGERLAIDELPQGTDFMAQITVSADFAQLNQRRLEDIALTLVMPSGWQIRNERLEGEELPEGLDYLDIRDDRVLAYFSLWRDYRWGYRYNDRNQTSVTLNVLLNASYTGRFYLPGWRVEAMYNERIRANTQGQWLQVVD